MSRSNGCLSKTKSAQKEIIGRVSWVIEVWERLLYISCYTAIRRETDTVRLLILRISSHIKIYINSKGDFKE